jgi:two-component system chemotaxis sensor kinase CheA
METRPLRRILLIDNDERLVEIMKLCLQNQGYAIVAARDGREAMTAVQENDDLDLIILELMLPVMDGLRFLHWLRRERGTDLPVLALTAADNPGLRDDLATLGVSEVALKPIRLAALLAHLHRLLDQPAPNQAAFNG